MSLVDLDFIKENITSDGGPEVPYTWSHGANKLHIGDGIVIYALIQQIRAKVCVCLGSGGGFIPRIMTQARRDLWTEGIFTGNDCERWGDIGVTYVVDACNEVGGHVSWVDENSFFRTNFQPAFIKDTTENAFYNFFVKQNIKIDFLHIDADHSYEGVRKDFELYSQIMSPGGIISLHDSDETYEPNLIVTEEHKLTWDKFDGPSKLVRDLDNSWEKITLFNEGKLQNAPSSTGLTIVQKKKPKIRLVTVVGDFHKDLTLVQMLKHYDPWVDQKVVVHYIAGDKTPTEVAQESLEFSEYLAKNNVAERVAIHTVTGKKYDWDKVTEFYNSITCNPLNNPDDWWIIADCDEFQVWRDEPKNIIEEARELNCTFITGGFLDRLGEGGTFPEIKGPEDNLDELFPLVGFFRYPLSNACPNKVVAVKSGQKVCSGQHYAVFPDGTNSWGTQHPLRYPVEKCFVQVHHFKWDSTVLDRLIETGLSGCSYSDEYYRMWKAIQATDCIDVANSEFKIEKYNPEKGYYSYKYWNQLRKQIVQI